MASMSAPADFQHDPAAHGTLRFSGNLSLSSIGDLPERLAKVGDKVSAIDLSGIERIDTVGAWLVHRFARESGATVSGLSGDSALLYERVVEADHPVEKPPRPPGTFTRLLGEVGE